MFVAQLHGKLTRSEEDMEDLLTSNVFGVWRYLSHSLGLVQFLETAQRLDGTRFTLPAEVKEIKLEFWPWIQEGNAKNTQPDVLMEVVLCNQEKWLVLIEAKFLSGKSSFKTEAKDDPPNDQLAREMHNLRIMAEHGNFNQYALIYVTAHTSMPKDDIREATSELRSKIGDANTDHFYWTSWRTLPAILAEVRKVCNEGYAIMLDDLQQILDRLCLVLFGGVTSQGWTLGEPSWVFKRPEVAFDWEVISVGHYNFRTLSKRFKWVISSQATQTPWRFKTWKKKIGGS